MFAAMVPKSSGNRSSIYDHTYIFWECNHSLNWHEWPHNAVNLTHLVPQRSLIRSLDCFLTSVWCRQKEDLKYSTSECGEMQRFIPHQYFWDNTHSLYKVNLIFCEIIVSEIPDKYRSGDFTFILVSSSVSFSRQGAHLHCLQKRNSSQSVPNTRFVTITADIPKSDMFHKVIYAVWLPRRHRSKLIRCMTCHTRWLRAKLSQMHPRERSCSDPTLILVC